MLGLSVRPSRLEGGDGPLASCFLRPVLLLATGTCALLAMEVLATDTLWGHVAGSQRHFLSPG